jgi:ABC-2 type transport system ATP-binding protein
MEEVFAGCVAERVAAGTTVLLSSHILSEVERLADRVTIIRAGRTVESGSLDELRHLRRSRIRAEVTGAVPDLTGVPGVHDLALDGTLVGCTVEPDALPTVLAALTGAGVITLTSSPPSLEELFLDAYRADAPPASSLRP